MSNTGTPLKDQCNKFCRGRTKWTRAACGESGVEGSEERVGRTASKIPVQSHSPKLQKPSVSEALFPISATFASGEPIALPIGNSLTPPYGVYTPLKSKA